MEIGSNIRASESGEGNFTAAYRGGRERRESAALEFNLDHFFSESQIRVSPFVGVAHWQQTPMRELR
jgi:hypothetical protein